MSSLYDQYNSKENIEHMYKLISEILQNNYNIVLNTINDYNIFMNNLKIVFNNTNSDNLIDLNKELLLNNIKFFLSNKGVDNSNMSSEISIDNSNTNTMDNINTMNNGNKLTELNENKEPNLILRYNEFIQERPNEFNNQNEINNSNESNNLNELNNPNELNKSSIILSSSDRNNGTSRFNYTVNNIKQVLSLDKLIIPIENTSHFTSPLLKLIVNEINYETILHLKETYKLNNYTYGIYKPENSKILNNSNKLTIQIISIFENVDYLPDIYECYNDNNIITGNYDIDDLKVNDIIQIRFGKDFKEKEYSRVIAINNNEIEIEELKNDIKECFILNMNLQNTLLFN